MKFRDVTVKNKITVKGAPGFAFETRIPPQLIPGPSARLV
jgi:hypothetical protein